MEIASILVGILKIPLIRPFITAVRRTSHVEDVVVMVKTVDGLIGYGSAAATPAITGESQQSILHAIQTIIGPKLIGKRIDNFNQLLHVVETSLIKNSSAKAAVDIALHDLMAQYCKLPLYKFLGGSTNTVSTCITISVKEAKEMASDAKLLVSQGFKILKLKVGLNPVEDIERIQMIRQAVGEYITILVDANQGWNTKSALQVIRSIEQQHLGVAVVEQPVKASDLTNLKFIRDAVDSFIMADEACFSPEDAFAIAKSNASDGVNIKLMKSGGIYNANAIYHIANSASIQCMVGCMLESPIGVAAMASFALSKTNIKFVDLDPIALIQSNPVIDGARLVGDEIVLAEQPGLGINGFSEGFTQLYEIK